MLRIETISKEDWAKISTEAHLISFGEYALPHEDRIDYAVLVLDGEKPAGFSTIKEMDSVTAYMQHGGAFPDHEKTVHVVKQYRAMLKFLASKYEIVTTRILNTNTAMLRLAMSSGFVINGTYFHKPNLYVELKFDCRGF